MKDNHRDWHVVADAADIDDPGSFGFTLLLDSGPLFGFVVRQNERFFAYENFCPHAGRQLNWGPHRFLTRDKSMIMCSAHGALFEISSGQCAAGPCQGEALQTLPLRERDGALEIGVSGRCGRETPVGPPSPDA